MGWAGLQGSGVITGGGVWKKGYGYPIRDERGVYKTLLLLNPPTLPKECYFCEERVSGEFCEECPSSAQSPTILDRVEGWFFVRPETLEETERRTSKKIDVESFKSFFAEGLTQERGLLIPPENSTLIDR